MSKQYKVEQVEAVKQEGNRITYGGREYELVGEGDCHLKRAEELPFKELKDGERFTWGGEEHIKIQELTPKNIGIVNNVCLAPNKRSGQVSGMGDNVLVKPLAEHHSNGFDEKTHARDSKDAKQLQDTLANIKQLQDDNYRAGQRLSTMQATVYTVFARLTGEPGYEYSGR